MQQPIHTYKNVRGIRYSPLGVELLPDHKSSGPPLGHSSRAVEAVESVSDGVLTVDLNSNVIYMNPAAVRLTGWSMGDALGRPVLQVFHAVSGDTKTTLAISLQAVMENDEERGLPPGTVLVRKDGVQLPIEDAIAPIHDHSGAVTGAVINFRNASIARILLLKALHRAHHDPLTDLPNRMILEDRIGQAICSIQRRPHLIAILFLDLDNFKQINDSRGHSVGDTVLRVIAKRLIGAVRASDTVCRLGGDEFVILFPEVKTPEDLTAVADHILSAIRRPVTFDGETLQLTASIGAVLQANDRITVSELLREGDAAMYGAKKAGGDRVQTYTPDATHNIQRRVDVEAALCRALEFGEFRLYYQPQVDLATGKICGAEALLRWRTPDGTFLSPMSFIPIAERSELIVSIGQWVLKEATRQQLVWCEAGFTDLTISTNVSPIELQHSGYLNHLDAIFQQAGLNPHYSLLEITESVLLMQIEEKESVLSAIRHRGLRLAIDDFGTGYSNIAYIRNFPLDVVKIDKSFIAECTSNEQDALLVKAMVHMGRSLEKTVIAEGIETKEQLAFLQESSCHQGQGFYFSVPLSADAFTTLLERPDGMRSHLC